MGWIYLSGARLAHLSSHYLPVNGILNRRIQLQFKLFLSTSSFAYTESQPGVVHWE